MRYYMPTCTTSKVIFFSIFFLATYTFRTELQQIGGCSEKTDRLSTAMQNLALDFLVRLNRCQGQQSKYFINFHFHSSEAIHL